MCPGFRFTVEQPPRGIFLCHRGTFLCHGGTYMCPGGVGTILSVLDLGSSNNILRESASYICPYPNNKGAIVDKLYLSIIM